LKRREKTLSISKKLHEEPGFPNWIWSNNVSSELTFEIANDPAGR
jgi:hypothetical protein